MSQLPGTPGQIIADRYELLLMIGRGGMGCVWRAEHRTLKTPVAVKLLMSTRGEAASVARFHREAKAAASLRGSHVVHIFDYGVEGDVPFIAMEYLEGETLGARLRRDDKLAPAEVARIMTGVMRAMSRAHRAGIIHRDLKPDNVFLARDEDAGEVVKVLDFGIAKIVDPDAIESEDASTRTGAMLGTPFYMSPEQARGRKDLDARSDLWALAVIAFECLTGKRPFEADVIGELVMQICSEPIVRPSDVSSVPSGFDAWFDRATRRDPALRFQSVREFSDALFEVLTPDNPWVEARSEDDAAKAPTAALALAPTEEVAPNTGGAASVSLATTRGAAPVNGTWKIAAAVAGVAAIGLLGWRAIGASAPERRVVTERSTLVFNRTAPPPTPPAVPAHPVEVRRRLVILPPDATVEIDGKATPCIDGEAVVSGTAGSVHVARISKGDTNVELRVVITEEGILPGKIEIPSMPRPITPAASPLTARPPTPPAIPSPPRRDADKPPVPDKFE